MSTKFFFNRENVSNYMIIGIDATNITQGGGITHIKNILNNSNEELLKLKKIIIWGNKETLKAIKKRKNIKKIQVYNIENKTNQKIYLANFLF